MPDLPDINTPLPDIAHESLRQSTVAALDQLADHLEQLADSFLLAQTASDFAQTVLTNFGALQQAVETQAAQIADLETRVSALENPTPPPATS